LSCDDVLLESASILSQQLNEKKTLKRVKILKNASKRGINVYENITQYSTKNMHN